MSEDQDYIQAPASILLAATPIGDVRDVSARLAPALEQADIIAAEDTRRLLALASRMGIRLSAKLISLHDHNESVKASAVVEQARAGARVVMVSDAGMPTVSDPGFRLVHEATAAGVHVSVLPGPSAPVTALALSGLPSDRFAFEGFLPRKTGEATRYLKALAQDPHTLIFFESPKRVHDTLILMAEVFGADRQAALCRELTKTYEEVIRGSLAELVEATEGEVLGEITLVIAPGHAQGNADDHVEAVLALAAEGMRLKDAAAEVAEATGLRKNELYRAALARTSWGSRRESVLRGDQLNSGLGHAMGRELTQLRADGLSEVREDSHLKTVLHAVQRCFADAVGLSKANDIQRIDTFVAKELKQGAFRCYILAIEGRIRGLVHALVDGDIRMECGKGWMQLGLGSTCNAVRRPGVNEVGVIREMRPRINMPIL